VAALQDEDDVLPAELWDWAEGVEAVAQRAAEVMAQELEAIHRALSSSSICAVALAKARPGGDGVAGGGQARGLAARGRGRGGRRHAPPEGDGPEEGWRVRGDGLLQLHPDPDARGAGRGRTDGGLRRADGGVDGQPGHQA